MASIRIRGVRALSSTDMDIGPLNHFGKRTENVITKALTKSV